MTSMFSYMDNDEAIEWVKQMNEIGTENEMDGELLNSMYKAKTDIPLSKPQFILAVNEYHPLAGHDEIANAVYNSLIELNPKGTKRQPQETTDSTNYNSNDGLY